MLRALDVIVSAILLSRPTMPLAEARHYAAIVSDEAQKRDFDPLTVVAIVHFESHWLPGVISGDGEDYGLGQVRGRWLSACRGDDDPVHAPSPGCVAAKQTLLSGETNLRRVGMLISANRELCKEKTGRGDLPRWLAGYEGTSFPRLDRWCAPGPKAWRVVAYRRELIAKLAPPKPVAKVAARHAASAPAARRAPIVKRASPR